VGVFRDATFEVEVCGVCRCGLRCISDKGVSIATGIEIKNKCK